MNLEELKNQTFWKHCSTCKKEIAFEALYYLCTVSTCRGKRVNMVFCSTMCWDGHLGFSRHRNAACEEEKAPNRQQFIKQASEHLQ